MAVFQDVQAPYTTMVPQASAPVPAPAGTVHLYISQADGLLYTEDSSGDVYPTGVSEAVAAAGRVFASLTFR
jgi:hypothetical protein